ncbi:TIGR01777 family oxidoreductase [Paenibacillus xylaniclasticus]|uniref:TIGR01777 family oxidoreductase n=1 Tax=Paenibacillus xylaniclasticus TaxID=588083 RepID=UPI0027D7EA20|nr:MULTISPECIES: TIGR01777 family oxidoreductase [Paenibacillus]
MAVAGGTGFIGQALVKALLARGDEPIVVTRTIPESSRRQHGVQYITWDDADNADRIGRVDAIVNLAGESINQRWTAAGKQRIVQSRIIAAEGAAAIAAAQPTLPRAVVHASGISVYGPSDHRVFDESSPPGTGFLSDVVQQWEAAADLIPTRRIVKLRIGLVIHSSGGAFPLMALPYKLFIGGRVGSGKQWLPWIHLDDMVRLLLFCLDTESLSGPVNACAPGAVTNEQFGRAIARAFRRPHWLPVPAFAIRTLFGEMSSLLLEGQQAVPRRAVEAGFQFRYSSVDEAMQAIAGNNR